VKYPDPTKTARDGLSAAAVDANKNVVRSRSVTDGADGKISTVGRRSDRRIVAVTEKNADSVKTVVGQATIATQLRHA
jgi:hypothetical protein